MHTARTPRAHRIEGAKPARRSLTWPTARASQDICWQLGFTRFPHHEDDYVSGTRFDLRDDDGGVSDSIHEYVVHPTGAIEGAGQPPFYDLTIVDSYHECCELCARTRPPSLPPSPPQMPGPPGPPPYPPNPPPTPWAPWPPASPQAVFNPYAASAATVSVELEYDCRGIVFRQTGDDLHCYLKKGGNVHTYGPNTAVDVDKKQIGGDFVFVYPHPPPPPFVPIGAACQEFYFTPFADLNSVHNEGFGAQEPGMPPPVEAGIYTQPWECCSRCKQEYDCRGFTIDRNSRMCYLKTTNQPGNIGISLYTGTWTYHDPPSPPPSPPPPSPPPIPPPPSPPPPEPPPPSPPPPSPPVRRRTVRTQHTREGSTARARAHACTPFSIGTRRWMDGSIGVQHLERAKRLTCARARTRAPTGAQV